MRRRGQLGRNWDDEGGKRKAADESGPPTPTIFSSLMAQSNHASVLELNCLVLRDDTSHIFSVKIPDNDIVSTLKAIWTKKPNEFNHVDEFNHVAADKLVIWQVSFPDDDNLPQMLDELNFVESNALRRASTKLSKVFPTLPEAEHLHSLIQHPPTREPYLIDHITNF